VYWEAEESNGVLGEHASGENQVHECVWWCTGSCRDISRPDWSLGCSQTQQAMGGPKCPPLPQSGHPPSPPHYLPQGLQLRFLHQMPREKEQRGVLGWPLVGLWAWHRCPQSQQGMGGPKCPPLPQTRCPLSPPHYLHPGHQVQSPPEITREGEQSGGLDWTLAGQWVGYRCPQTPHTHGFPRL